VKSIVSFAKEANIQVIAEYVSSKEIYEMVRSLGIDYSQGFYFSVPKPL
ncbi:MAG: EAL domain-containing protein, partial [Sulfurimonadaceae bacterium]